jgi:hypothetical protein
VHKAKGLEFPVVILADPTCNESSNTPSRHVDPERRLWVQTVCGCAPVELLEAADEEEAVKLYQKIGFPALQQGRHDQKLVGYFQADTGTINQIMHLWKFDDDADRRAHWAAVYANKDFVEGFASKFRPLLITQEVKLLQAAPWGPHP